VAGKTREPLKHKIYKVAISLMRVPPVDVIQRRLDMARARGYATNFDFDKFGLPLLNHRDSVYWIVDGQHRIEAMKIAECGHLEIECEVYEGLTDRQMADLFLGRNNRVRVSNYTNFLVACTAGYERESEVRRLVESNRLKISRRQEVGCIGAVSSLLRVYDAYGSIVLGQVLRTIRDAFASDAAAFHNNVIVGLGLVFNRYNGKTQEKELIASLSKVQHGVLGLQQGALRAQDRNGATMTQCMAATIVDLYNRNVTKGHRLRSWWKDEPEQVAVNE
jgi:hypothetical protein